METKRMWQGAVGAGLLVLGGLAVAGEQYDYAAVADVEPILKRVRVVPEARCHVETVERRVARAPSASPVLGAVIGGAIGHALGHRKRNKRAGAVVGAALGGSIAHGLAEAPPRRVVRVREEVCEAAGPARVREEVVGYLVTYRYGGKTHRARVAEHPGETIRVRVSVAPAASP